MIIPASDFTFDRYLAGDYGDHCIIHGDCRDVLPKIPDKAIDLVLTDPPYGMNMNPDNRRFSGGTDLSKARRGVGTNNRLPVHGDTEPFDPSPLEKFDKRVIFGLNHFPNKLQKGTALVWIKRNDDAFGTFLSDAEIAWYSKGCGVYCFKDLSNNAIVDERAHPTQKPVPLFQWILEKYSNGNDLILDPFLGSGTTLVAAKNLGRRAIGIEINYDYCKIAEQRLRQEVLAL